MENSLCSLAGIKSICNKESMLTIQRISYTSRVVIAVVSIGLFWFSFMPFLYSGVWKWTSKLLCILVIFRALKIAFYNSNALILRVSHIVKILNLYIILLCTHLYHTSFQYLSITCNAFIACYIRCKKILVNLEQKNFHTRKI